jgi:hypothetical protein
MNESYQDWLVVQAEALLFLCAIFRNPCTHIAYLLLLCYNILMIFLDGEERFSRVQPESIDLSANQVAIRAMLEAARPLGTPLPYPRLIGIRPDIRAEFVGQYRDNLSLKRREHFDQEDFEMDWMQATVGSEVNLQMKPTDAPMRGRFFNVGPLGLQSSEMLGSNVSSGTLLGSVSLRNDGPVVGVLADIEKTKLTFDLHSIGSVIVRGHIDTRRNEQTEFWDALHLDDLTPLYPGVRHEIVYEPLGTPQVSALASYVLERLPIND